ncbi:peptide chain release factor N(5)-glutamine methyltransferase [Stratiformator vulcanicus]|uniref:Release factor glutamine methyltransferase n=1 Tax=Stratiformator vulcanicus TaxID=2527980 RepID=A0A517R013_9PLAN|nr:peptide chain release factor N(5)-glutamine methyltransferase [Stratiformator vulcanicus]QDT37208.1 Release factor glutamine methyltransferase [Stratiformator vulcanicus]
MATSQTSSPSVQNASVNTDAWTVRKILDWTTQHLKSHGSESPRLEAEILLAHSRGCPRIQLYVQFDEVLSDAQRAKMRDLVKRRANAEPVAYLVGYREFFSLRFEVTSDVLIPRPETETLVLQALAHLKTCESPCLLDLCTGSGCVAISAAKNCPPASVVATDLSPQALAVAGRNAETHEVSDRVQFCEGDLFEAVPSDAKFHVIATNPPYVADTEWESLSPDIRLHEPNQALLSGADGLDHIRKIVGHAAHHLAPGGMLIIELSPEQARTVCDLLATWAHRVEPIRDVDGEVRFVRCFAPLD